MKKWIATITACMISVMMFSGCDKLITKNKSAKKGATLEMDLTTAYVAEELNMQGMRADPIAVTSKGIIMTYWKSTSSSRMYLYDPEQQTYTEFQKNQPHAPAYATQLPDGRLCALYNIIVEKKGSQTIYDGIQRVMEIYDDNLQVTEEIMLPETVPTLELSRLNTIMDSQGRWYFIADDMEDGSYNVNIMDENFQLIGKIPFDMGFCNDLVVGKSGKIYALVATAEGNANQLYYFDADTMTSGKFCDIPAYTKKITQGINSELYCCTETDIESIDENGTLKQIVDYRNSNLPDNIFDAYAIPNSEFIIEYFPDGGSMEYYTLRPRTDEELKNVQFISLAGVGIHPKLVHDVCEFNQSQTEYHIIMKDYANDYPIADYDEYYVDGNYKINIDPKALEAFENDLMNGIVPDMICMDYMPYQQISNKGLLEDLAPMLEKDERFNPNDYYMNLIDGMKKGDKLEEIGFSFTLDTNIAKTEIVGTQQGRTPDEYISMIEQLPDDMELLPITSREEMTNHFLTGSQEAFIDRNNMTSHFNCDSFIKLLELAGSFQTKEELLGEEEDYFAEYYKKLNEGGALLDPFSICNPIDYHNHHHGFFKDEDVTFVGYPDTSGGNGGRYRMNYTVALTSYSTQAKPVWEFIMAQLSAQRQARICLRNNNQTLPLLRSTMQSYLKGATIPNQFMSYASETEIKELGDYLENVRMYTNNDPYITNIITEEAEMYFSEDQTAEKCAEMIESRVNLYLSEQQ